jgi:hypothetical protein
MCKYVNKVNKFEPTIRTGDLQRQNISFVISRAMQLLGLLPAIESCVYGKESKHTAGSLG